MSRCRSCAQFWPIKDNVSFWQSLFSVRLDKCTNFLRDLKLFWRRVSPFPEPRPNVTNPIIRDKQQVNTVFLERHTCCKIIILHATNQSNEWNWTWCYLSSCHFIQLTIDAIFKNLWHCWKIHVFDSRMNKDIDKSHLQQRFQRYANFNQCNGSTGWVISDQSQALKKLLVESSFQNVDMMDTFGRRVWSSDNSFWHVNSLKVVGVCTIRASVEVLVLGVEPEQNLMVVL